MSIKYLNKAFDCKEFKSMEKLLMIAICDTVNDDGFGYPGYKKLMVKTSMAKATLSKHLDILKNAGIFTVESHGSIGKGRKVNTYQVLNFWTFSDLKERLKIARDNRKVQPLNLSQKPSKSSTLEPDTISSTLEPRKVQPLNPKSSTLEHEPSVLTTSNEPPVKDGYAFCGETINVTDKDFDQMKTSYPNLDLIAELKQLDLELKGEKKYWMPLNAKLNYRNRKSGETNGNNRNKKETPAERKARRFRELREAEGYS